MRTVEEIIIDSLQELKNIACEGEKANKYQKSKLVFPKYRDDNQEAEQNVRKRISEQGAKLE